MLLGLGASPGSPSEVASDGGWAGPSSHALQTPKPATIACIVADLASQSCRPLLGERLPPKSSSLNFRDHTTNGPQIRRSTMRITIPIATMQRICAFTLPLSIASLK